MRRSIQHRTSLFSGWPCPNWPDRPIYIVFDQDENLAGRQASQQLRLRLERAGGTALTVRLPAEHDPNSYFVSGATAAGDVGGLLGDIVIDNRERPALAL